MYQMARRNITTHVCPSCTSSWKVCLVSLSSSPSTGRRSPTLL